jgi:hypothetical protein
MTKIMEIVVDRPRQIWDTEQDQVVGEVGQLLAEFPAPEEVTAIGG